MISVALAATEQDVNDARELMRRYAQWTGVDLCFQGGCPPPLRYSVYSVLLKPSLTPLALNLTCSTCA